MQAAGYASQPPLNRMPGRSAVLLFFCLALAIGTSLWLGQDANWDLQNYHYYNPHAWVQERWGIDIAPAQLQSYHSPFADLPYYFMVRGNFPPWLISALLAVPAAAALFFLALLSDLLLHSPMRRYGTFAVILLAASGACGRPVIGSTMSEWHITALFMAAIWFSLKFGFDGSDAAGPTLLRRRIWLICGLLVGLAVGLKLTGAAFGMSFALLVLWPSGDLRQRVARLCEWSLGGLVGFAVFYAPWGWHLWVHYQNPFFPYFNDLFHSPLVDPLRYADMRFAAHSIEKLVLLPFRLMQSTTGMVAEVAMRDWRLALGLSSLAWLAIGIRGNRCGPIDKSVWRALFLFGLVSYLIWAYVSGIYRYIGTLELLISLAIVAAAANIVPRYAGAAVACVVLLVAGTTDWPRWGRVSFEIPAVSAQVPALPENSMVVIASGNPLAYVVPSLPKTVPVVSLINNFMHLEPGRNQMQIQATQRVKGHSGPVWLLVHSQWEKEVYSKERTMPDALRELGFLVDADKCLPFKTAIDKGMALCPLRNAPQ